MSTSSENASGEGLVPGCEICTRDDLIDRQFHYKPTMFFENTTIFPGKRHKTSGRGARWPLESGVIGSQQSAKICLRGDEISPEHAAITWDGDSDTFYLESLHERESYLLLSCARACREAIKLKDGDAFLLSYCNGQSSTRLNDLYSRATSFTRLSTKTDLNSSNKSASAEQLPGKAPTSSGVDPAHYIRIRVRIVQSNKQGDHRAPLVRKLSKRRTYTMLRAGDSPSLPSLTMQKAGDLHLEELLQGFQQAAQAYQPDSAGSLLTNEQADIVKKEHKGHHVAFAKHIEGEVTETTKDLAQDMSRLQRNLFGGSSVIEDEALLDAVWCDTDITSEQMRLAEAATSRVGVQIKSGPEQDSEEKESNTFEDLLSSGAAQAQHELDSLFNCRIELEIENGPEGYKGQKFSFGVHDISIGSHRMNDVHIDGLANFHARIERDKDNQYWLRDLAGGRTLSTLLVLRNERKVPILPDDIFRFGTHQEITARTTTESMGAANEIWDAIAVCVSKTRKSLRYRQLDDDSGEPSIPAFFVMTSSVEDIVIGRKVLECDIAVKDYEMPPFAATISAYERNFYVSAMPESRKKGVFIELSRRENDPHGFNGKAKNPLGRLHPLNKGDTFKIGRSQLTVAAKKVEHSDAINRRHSETFKALRRVNLFKGLLDDELRQLASAVCIIKFKEGDVIIRQGSKVTGMFVVAEGLAHVFHENSPDKILNKVSVDNVLGEMALFANAPATASVRASGDMTCLYIDFYLAKAVIHPSNFEVIKTLVDHRRTQAHVHDLQNVPELQNLDNSKLLMLSRRLFRVVINSPSQLFNIGDEHECMYIVSVGKLYISTSPESNRRQRSFKPLSRRNSYVPVPGGGHIFEKMLQNALNEPRKPFKSPYSVATNEEVVLFGLHRDDYVSVMKMDEAKIREELETSRVKINDLLPEHFASDRILSARHLITPISSPQTRTAPVDITAQSKGSVTDTGSVLSNRPSTDSFKFSPIQKSTKSKSVAASLRISPDDLVTMGGSERLRLGRRNLSTSKSQSVDEGSEGDTLAYLERLVSGNTISSEPDSLHSNATMDIDNDDGDTISLASTETAEMSDLESAEILTDDETFDMELFSKRTELETRLHGMSLGQIENELANEPFYLILKCIAGPQKRQLFILTSSVTIIGRWTSTSRDEELSDPLPGRRVISLNDRTVSRVNSIVQYRNGDFFLHDVESKYGTHIKLKANEDLKLEIGDIISCSQHEFKIYARARVNLSAQKSACCSIS